MCACTYCDGGAAIRRTLTEATKQLQQIEADSTTNASLEVELHKLAGELQAQVLTNSRQRQQGQRETAKIPSGHRQKSVHQPQLCAAHGVKSRELKKYTHTHVYTHVHRSS